MGRNGTLERNRSIGIKSRHTLAGDEQWRRGHKAASIWLITAGFTAITFNIGGLASALWLSTENYSSVTM
ncbi:SdpI family protein [Kocuria sp.]|uniref:SdpI family protein n=1 Tax=Kocuria sp. TaxID=1871328 RepID=UPI0034CDA478